MKRTPKNSRVFPELLTSSALLALSGTPSRGAGEVFKMTKTFPRDPRCSPYLDAEEFYSCRLPGKSIGVCSLRPFAVQLNETAAPQKISLRDGDMRETLKRGLIPKSLGLALSPLLQTTDKERWNETLRFLLTGAYDAAIERAREYLSENCFQNVAPENAMAKGILLRAYLQILARAYEFNGDRIKALNVYDALYGEFDVRFLWAQARIFYAGGDIRHAFWLSCEALWHEWVYGMKGAAGMNPKNDVESAIPTDSILGLRWNDPCRRVSLQIDPMRLDDETKSRIGRIVFSCALTICPELEFIASSKSGGFVATVRDAFERFHAFMESQAKVICYNVNMETPQYIGNPSGAITLLREMASAPYALRSSAGSGAAVAEINFNDAPPPPRMRCESRRQKPLPIENEFIAQTYSLYVPSSFSGYGFMENREELLGAVAEGEYDRAIVSAKEGMKKYCPWNIASDETKPPRLFFRDGAFFRQNLLTLATAYELQGRLREAAGANLALYEIDDPEYIWVDARVRYAAGDRRGAFLKAKEAIDATLTPSARLALESVDEREEGKFPPELFTLWKLRDSFAKVICPELHFAAPHPFYITSGKTLDAIQKEASESFLSFMESEKEKAKDSEKEDAIKRDERMIAQLRKLADLTYEDDAPLMGMQTRRRRKTGGRR